MFGLLFFALHLALMLKIVPVGEEFTADRYLYLPLIGLLVPASSSHSLAAAAASSCRLGCYRPGRRVLDLVLRAQRGLAR